MAGLGFAGEATEAWVCQLSQPRVAEKGGKEGHGDNLTLYLGFTVWPRAPFWALGSLTTQGGVGSWYLRVPKFG